MKKSTISVIALLLCALFAVFCFYRVNTAEKNLDLLFVVILAFARSGAMDDKGGTFGMLKGTLKD